jgi:ATP-dependent helicase/nuclease subunit B
MAASSRPRVFSIPAGVPFLPVLVDAILSGRLVTIDRSEPLALADLTVFLPTRRAVRAFRDAIGARLGDAILPQVRPLGDIDEDDLLFATPDETTAERLTLPPAIPFLSRHLALTRLILAWRETLARASRSVAEGDGLRIPASAADAARLARDLTRLGDDMAISGVSWEALRSLAGDDHAHYFQITLDFLKIVAEQWPAHLAEIGRLDPAARRDQLIRQKAAALGRNGSDRPFIVAGSTGSMPASAELIKAVARLPNGAVVLPGLDRDLDASGWEAIGAAGEPNSADAHPQFALKQLIARIGIARDDVEDIAAAPSPGRARLLSEAMRPAGTAERWTGFAPGSDVLDGVSLLVARNEQEEATAIALAIRQAIETDGAAIALVTPDRTIARRVAAELARWDIAVDDSAGARLDREPAGVFARLLLEAATEPSAVRLLALAKHPLAAFGLRTEVCRRAARALELGVLRGRRIAGGISGLVAATATARAEVEGKTAHVPVWRRRLFPEDWDGAMSLAEAMTAALGPLAAALGGTAGMTAAEASALLRAGLSAAATDEAGSTAGLWASASGAVLDALLTGLGEEVEAGRLMLAAGDAPYLLAELMRDATVSRGGITAHRVQIWGTLEARLQSVDLMILGGLDEGVWPSVMRTDPWLSRAMRAEVGLPPPERRLGLAAHDFVQAMAVPQVIVTRAEKRAGAPTVESRWLQRIRALAGKAAVEAMIARGTSWVGLARAIDAPAADKPTPTPRPEPRPPLAVRPPSLSITEIETLIRDPYAIYAKHVLRLQELDPLGAPADARIKGILVHDALGRFIGEWSAAFDGAAEKRLVDIMQEVLAAVKDAPDVLAVWSHRFRAIANWMVLVFEASRQGVEKRHPEIKGSLPVPTSAGVFTLTGRADRVDLLTGNGVAIFDFKTGTPQSDRSVFAGLTPQMTLEAAMAKRGAFDGIAAGRSVRELAWLAVGKCGRADPYMSAVLERKGETADSLAEKAFEMLTGLAEAFADPDRAYLSRARPMFEGAHTGAFDHLARVREWGLVESEEEAGF